jgi:hypothetical protein
MLRVHTAVIAAAKSPIGVFSTARSAHTWIRGYQPHRFILLSFT